MAKTLQNCEIFAVHFNQFPYIDICDTMERYIYDNFHISQCGVLINICMPQ